MALPIEDYALIGDTFTAALVGRDGSIDWLCLPRFDSPSCFAALLGQPEHGRWLVAPRGGARKARRAYRDGTLVLDTTFETEGGVVTVTDFMPRFAGDDRVDVARVVTGVAGRVEMETELIVRFDYGRRVPWVRRHDGALVAVAGPDSVHLWSGLPIEGNNRAARANFVVEAGRTEALSICWHPSHEHPPAPVEAGRALRETEAWWRAWSAKCTYGGDYRDEVVRSLVTLKALTYSPTGGIVAAPTTSLPEDLGGMRNWDYRYCWLRDATFTLYSLMQAGYAEEARAWREWLLRAVAGEPRQLQILYGVGGENHLPEEVVDWLPGYEGSRPVRIGNAARGQLQLDVYGELMDALHAGRKLNLKPDHEVWEMQRAFLDNLESTWRHPDEGLWEVRGPRRHFTHSNVMAWVAVDRAIKDAESLGFAAPLDRWRALRDAIKRDVCSKGFDSGRGSFVQFYGGKGVDAALLMLPLVGFLPCDDERVRGTVAAVERELMEDGLLRRYSCDTQVDGLPGGEGAFLACTFWYVDVLLMMGRRAEAEATFRHLLSLANDVGLLAEEYDTARQRQVGNFPQAFSHVSLVNSARNLAMAGGPAEQRSKG